MKDKKKKNTIQNKTKKKYYLQYQLDAGTKSVIRQRYIKKSRDAFLMPVGPKKQAYCANVKADWEGKMGHSQKRRKRN